MINAIDNVVNAISGVLYQPYIVPLILVLAGLYFTIRLGLIQVSLFGESIRVVSEKPVNLGATSSFGALMVSTASRVGTGNIMGVSTALCLGGPGALFWMWITAILGGASAFVESTLAQIYKKKDSDGGYYGGPSYYMQSALGQRWLGVVFAIVLILTYMVGYNMLAAYNTQDTFYRSRCCSCCSVRHLRSGRRQASYQSHGSSCSGDGCSVYSGISGSCDYSHHFSAQGLFHDLQQCI